MIHDTKEKGKKLERKGKREKTGDRKKRKGEGDEKRGMGMDPYWKKLNIPTHENNLSYAQYAFLRKGK